jgi:hypothetical protein
MISDFHRKSVQQSSNYNQKSLECNRRNPWNIAFLQKLNTCSGRYEISVVFRNPKFIAFKRTRPTVSLLVDMNLAQNYSYFFKIHFNMILPSTTRSSPLLSGFISKPRRQHFLWYASNKHQPTHSTRLHNLINIM